MKPLKINAPVSDVQLAAMKCIYNRFRWIGFAVLAGIFYLIAALALHLTVGAVPFAIVSGICFLIATYWSLAQWYHSFKAWSFLFKGRIKEYGEFSDYLLVDNVVIIFLASFVLSFILILSGFGQAAHVLGHAFGGVTLLWGMVMFTKARPYALAAKELAKVEKELNKEGK